MLWLELVSTILCLSFPTLSAPWPVHCRHHSSHCFTLHFFEFSEKHVPRSCGMLAPLFSRFLRSMNMASWTNLNGSSTEQATDMNSANKKNMKNMKRQASRRRILGFWRPLWPRRPQHLPQRPPGRSRAGLPACRLTSGFVWFRGICVFDCVVHIIHLTL